MKNIYRIIEIKFFETLVYILRQFFKSEEDYFKTIMFFRSILRPLFKAQLTSSEEFQKKRSNYYKDCIDKNSIVLDIGCGVLGIGAHVIRFLPKQAYIGVDISKPVIRLAKKKIEKDISLKDKNPKILITSSSDDVKSIAEKHNCDTFIFNSVFTHMSSNLISSYLDTLSKINSSKIKILGDISVPKSNKSFQVRGVDHYYTVEDFTKICDKSNLDIQLNIGERSDNIYTTYLFKLTKKN